MRRTVRTLSVAVLAGAAFGATGTAAAAVGPAAGSSPADARPGAVVTVSVTCADAGGRAPAAIDATSTAFAGRDGTRTVDGTCPAASGQQARPWGAHLALARDDAGTPSVGDGGTFPQGDGGAMPQVGGGAVPPVGSGVAPPPQVGGGTVPGGSDGTVTGGGDGMYDGTFAPGDAGTTPRDDAGTTPRDDAGTAPRDDAGAAPRGDASPGVRGDDGGTGRAEDGTASRGDDGTAVRGDRGDGDAASRGDVGAAVPPGEDGDVSHGSHAEGERPCSAGQQSCGGAQECGEARGGDGSCAATGVQHGVAAGDGGAYNTSVPALVAGAMLIAAACCGAAYRMWGGRAYRLWAGRTGAGG
ncbi:hypothetical protein AB0E08_27410 [Streptomyces sp. NPDC048281]|uniref:hypothetical protein n=1 Tax=Streptomyces sp. NPDC048281 TaxID=3154715 RepID=UPI00341661AD